MPSQQFPKIKFKISPTKDVLTFFAFLRDAEYDGGRGFRWAVLNYYPHFRKFKIGGRFVVPKIIVKKFVDDQYCRYGRQIERNFSVFKKDWESRAAGFFELTERLFPKTAWPDGKYVAYSTIWCMYPRFLEDKTFQVPGRTRKKKAIPRIITHEMLHFMFYAYFFRKHKKYRTQKYGMFVWHISEIFNSIVLGWPEWQKLLKDRNLDYPEHRPIIKKLREEGGDRELTADQLTRKIIQAVRAAKLAK